MHTVRLALDTTKQQHDMLCESFYLLWRIHNVLVKFASNNLKKLDKDQQYQNYKDEYRSLCKKGIQRSLSKEERARKAELSAKMNEIIAYYNLTKSALEKYIKISGRKYKKHLSSLQVQKEAFRVYLGVEKVIYGDGERLSFKHFEDMHTIGGKDNKNGVRFDSKTLSAKWFGTTLVCKKKVFDDQYILEALNGDIKYCEIERKMFNNGWHFYLIVYVDGDAPRKLKQKDIGCGIMGLDIGVSSIAAVSDNTAILEELAPDCSKYNKKIMQLQRKMDSSKRKSNPNKYNKDGTINKRNKERWKYSHNYRKLRNQLRCTFRQKAAYIKESHEKLCNKLLHESDIFITENMNFRALQKKAKATKRKAQAEAIKQKDGTKKLVHKYKRKKRFGKSLNNRAPSELTSILQRKCQLYGCKLLFVNTSSYKASQYNHISNSYTKSRLQDRTKTIGEYTIQRDLYSAFLLKCSNKDLDIPNREKCLSDFPEFVNIHNATIATMKENNISMKQCFGF